MGRKYSTELARIPKTIEWALDQDVAQLRHTLLREFGSRNLVAVGSGGSLVAAAFAALLHETFTGRLARATTPLESINRHPPSNAAVLLLSARGSNPDILRAAEIMPRIGYDTVSAITTNVPTPLHRILSNYGATTHGFPVPGGRDGFLATNSLAATLVLLYKAFSYSHDQNDLDSLFSRPIVVGSEAVLTNQTLVVLAQGWSMPAAIDFETRFSEAALGNVTVTDPRNFAHGRHHWLSIYGANTGIVSLETSTTTRIATRTLQFLPSETQVLRIISDGEGPTSTIELVRAVMGFAGQVGTSRGIDPGRPKVAEFGRRLYNSRATPDLGDSESIAISKKRRALYVNRRSDSGILTLAFREFVRRFERTIFTGLVVDYDGTLCESERRFKPLERPICDELNRLLSENLLLGVASGRGGSVYSRLREAIDPQYWHQVVVGMYNGAQVFRLSAEIPDSSDEIPESLQLAIARLRRVERPLGFEIAIRPQQVSVRPVDGPDPSELRRVLTEQLNGIDDLIILASSHSVDILLKPTSKLAVVHALKSINPGYVLRIGDQGAVGGNDYELLNAGLSLSVDQVSSSLDTCWFLGDPGVSGPNLTLRYLRALCRGSEGFRFQVQGFVDAISRNDCEP